MAELAIPEEYLVEGLEAVHYDKPDDKCEAVTYVTPNGTRFALAKDFMGIQICMNGIFWPAVFPSFPSMTNAAEHLRKHTSSAVAVFDGARAEMEAKNGK